MLNVTPLATIIVDSVTQIAQNKLKKEKIKPTSIPAISAWVIKKVLDCLDRTKIHGIVHCSGGAQTKILHFLGDNLRVVKNNMFPLPPLFRIIRSESQTTWEEMYKVFNMGHRVELYLPEEFAQEVIDISHSFNVDAQIIGHVEQSNKKELIIQSPYGTFEY